VIPSDSNYVTETFFGPAFTSPDSPKLELLAELMNVTTLRKRMQDQMGASKARALYDPIDGALSITTSKDPNAVESYLGFERVLADISTGSFK